MLKKRNNTGMMKTYFKINIVNIASLIFLVFVVSMLSVIVYILAWEVLGIVWMALGITSLLLLLISCAYSAKSYNQKLQPKENMSNECEAE